MSALDNLKDLFARRFEPDGAGYLFRHKLTAPGYRVGAEERDRFVASFNRDIGRAIWGVVGIMSVMLGGAAWWSIASGETSSLLIGVAVVGSVLANVVTTRWLWGAPLRALRDRQPVVDGLSKPEARREAFRRMTWGQLLAGLGLTALFAWRGYSRDPNLTGEGRWWLAGTALMLALFSVQALRKWLSDREG